MKKRFSFIFAAFMLFSFGCDEGPDHSNCGNGKIDKGEACDGENFNQLTCKTFDENYNSGSLKCSSSCEILLDGCSTSLCPNGTRDEGEDCDGTDLNNQSCESVDARFSGGNLSCNNSCRFDTSACTLKETKSCGNRVREDGEECDGQDFGAKTCETQNPDKAFGTLSCTADCKISSTWCFSGDVGLQAQMPKAESTDLICSNGKNDYNTVDKNGNISNWFDCNSHWCTQLPLVQVCGSLENTDALCSNNKDDAMMPTGPASSLPKGNGLIDCEDPSCFKNPRVTVCHETHGVKYELGAECKDGIDNDGDTLADCEDLDCLQANTSDCVLGNKKRILFDNAHHQMAGNADFIVDVTGRRPFPTIPQNENDWHGGLSSWGKDLIDSGKYVIETLPQDRVFSYKSEQIQDLKNYHILISVDPSLDYSEDEINAIYDFINEGGSFMLVADHQGSDRDGNTWDSVAVFNDMVDKLESKYEKNPFGIRALLNTSMSTLTATIHEANKTHPILSQPNTINEVASYAGTAFEITDSTVVKTLLDVNEQAYALVGKIGKGKFFVIGDSSIASDATDSMGVTQQYNGYKDQNYQNSGILMNAVEWLATPESN